MKCDNPKVPKYLRLHDKRRIYDDGEFLSHQKLYRLKMQGNPIEIPEQWANAVSCRWSKLIKRKHIVMPLETPTSVHNDYDYVFLQEIRNYKKTGTLPDAKHQYAGRHVITCHMEHTALDCNYSHVEILIHHQVYPVGSDTPTFDQVYTYEDWKDKTAMLNKEGGKFFKGLKKAFRLDMIKLISREPNTNTLINDIKAYCKRLTWNDSIDPNFTLD